MRTLMVSPLRVLALGVLAGSLACHSRGLEPVQALDTRLQQLYAESQLPGFAVAVVTEDAVVYQRGFGYADLEKRTPYTPQTIQPVGSVSKTFIALALMKAIEQGHFTLDTPIDDILPFKVVNPHHPEARIRIQHLVTHTSGILDRESTYLRTYVPGKKAGVALGDFLRDYLSPSGGLYHPENFSDSAPGEAFHYTNIGSALAAYLIELKTGESFADYTRKLIFEPLQMEDSHWLYDDARAPEYASLYDVHHKPYAVYSSVTYPDGALKTSCRDLARYLMEVMRGQAGHSNLLMASSFQTMLSPRFSAGSMPREMNAREPNRGVFWAFNRAGRLVHTGGDPGVSAFISFDPRTRVGRVALINTELDESEELTRQFREIVEALQEFEQRVK